MILLVLLFYLLGGVVVFNAMRKGLLNSPDAVFFIWWGLLLGLYIFSEDELVELSDYFIWYITIFGAVFSISFRLGLFINFKKISFKIFFSPYFLYSIGLSLSLYSLIVGYASFSNAGFNFSLLRASINDGSSQASLGVGLSFPICAACAVYAREVSRSYISSLFYGLLLMLALVSTSKIFIILFIFYAYPWHKDNINFKWIFLSSLLILVGFGVSHFLLEKFSSNPDDGILTAILNTFKVYLLGGIAALQIYIKNPDLLPGGIMYTGMPEIASIFINVPTTDILPWSYFGKWNGNVYTAFAYWINSFGFISCLIMGGLLGFYYSIFFRNKCDFSRDFYKVFLVFCIIITFFQDHYFPSFKMHVAFIISSLMLRFINQRKGVL